MGLNNKCPEEFEEKGIWEEGSFSRAPRRRCTLTAMSSRRQNPVGLCFVLLSTSVPSTVQSMTSFTEHTAKEEVRGQSPLKLTTNRKDRMWQSKALE